LSGWFSQWAIFGPFSSFAWIAKDLHEQWTAAGLPEALAIDETPSLPRGLDQRGQEIAAWLEMRPDVQRWVVLDDDRPAIERVFDPARRVFTDPARGLTTEDAGSVIHMFIRN